MFETYFPLLFQAFMAVVIGIAMVAVSGLLGKREKSAVKSEPYESGIKPTTDAHERFPVKFYLVAILFIVFDLETVFLFPWAVNFKMLGLFGLIEMGIFILILLIGYIYIIRKGALKWD